jgi:ParB family chromosome partitioning protein
MRFSFQDIHLRKLNFTDNWCLHPWEKEYYPGELRKSIIRTGIIHPPFLRLLTDKSFEVISGRKRLLIARRELRLEKTGCFILPDRPAEISILDLLLTDQIHAVPLTLAEKAQFIKIAVKHITEDEIIAHFAERLELREHPSAIREMLALLNLPGDIIAEIHNGRLQDRMVMELQRLKHPEDCLTMVSLFKKLALGTGKQRKIFSLLRDLAYRNHTSISDYLGGEEIQRILQHKEMNAPQKTQHLGILLQKQLNPSSQDAEDNFAIFSKSLNLPGSLSVSHSPAFETNEITLSIRCRDLHECEKILPEIRITMENRK